MTDKKYELRVNQLDAIQLDGDIFSILKGTLTKALSEISPGILIKYQPELDLILSSIIWRHSIHKNLTTFGQEMLFLKYDSSQLKSTKLVLHYVLVVLSKYLNDNINQRFISYPILQKISTYFEKVLNVFNFFNMFRFLKTGQMPTLVDFLLRLNYIPATNDQKRNIGFYYMTRELFWEGFIELVGITLPLINYHAMKRKFNGFVMNVKSEVRSLSGEEMDYSVTRADLCSFCNERPTNSSHFKCGHIYCYYCLNANLLADKEFMCTKCYNT